MSDSLFRMNSGQAETQRCQSRTKQEAGCVFSRPFLLCGFMHEDEHLSQGRAAKIAEFSLLNLDGFKRIILLETFNDGRTMPF